MLHFHPKIGLHESPSLRKRGQEEKGFFPIILLFSFGLDTAMAGHMLFFA